MRAASRLALDGAVLVDRFDSLFVVAIRALGFTAWSDGDNPVLSTLLGQARKEDRSVAWPLAASKTLTAVTPPFSTAALFS